MKFGPQTSGKRGLFGEAYTSFSLVGAKGTGISIFCTVIVGGDTGNGSIFGKLEGECFKTDFGYVFWLRKLDGGRYAVSWFATGVGVELVFDVLRPENKKRIFFRVFDES